MGDFLAIIGGIFFVAVVINLIRVKAMRATLREALGRDEADKIIDAYPVGPLFVIAAQYRKVRDTSGITVAQTAFRNALRFIQSR